MTQNGSSAPRRRVIDNVWAGGGQRQITLSCGHVWYVDVASARYSYGRPKTMRCETCPAVALQAGGRDV